MKKKYACPVCKSPNQFFDEGGYEICSICGWEDDDSQRIHLDEDGANLISLNEAKRMWSNGESIYSSHPNPQKNSN